MKTTKLFCKPVRWRCLLATAVMAAAPADQVAKIGSTLTPLGAEKAGNADGTIPEWTGGLPQNAGPVDDKGFVSDPFASEKPLFTITAQNVEQYKDKLTPASTRCSSATRKPTRCRCSPPTGRPPYRRT